MAEEQIPYAQALERVHQDAPRGNLMTITMGYNSFIVPYADGVAIMAHLAHAEYYDHSYGKEPKIESVKEEHLKSAVLSRKDYEDIKISQLLGIKVDEVKKMRLAVESFTKKDPE